jgi:pyroglutamyl-peptidase
LQGIETITILSRQRRLAMNHKILLTSFTTWRTDQKSNASDDLLIKILQVNPFPQQLHFFRKIPVCFQQAPEQAIAKLNAIQPDVIICCGMAESRNKLTVESQAVHHQGSLTTGVELNSLIAGLTMTEISHDAGRFVCNWLYYSVLKYICDRQLNSQCIFVHVPILTPENVDQVVSDFLLMIQRLLQPDT